MSGSFCFERHQRLLNKADFQGVFDQADFKIGVAEFLILAKRTADGNQARLGLIVAKKNVKTAVDRNCFKRQVRESFRLTQRELCGLDIIVMARKSRTGLRVAEADRNALRSSLSDAWLRLARKRNA